MRYQVGITIHNSFEVEADSKEQAEDKVDAGSLEQAIDQYEMILASYPGSKYAIQATEKYKWMHVEENADTKKF